MLHPSLFETVALLPSPLLFLSPFVFFCLGSKPGSHRLLMPWRSRRELPEGLTVRRRRRRGHGLASWQVWWGLRKAGSGRWLNWRQGRRRRQAAVRCGHELIGQTAASWGVERRLLAWIQIYQGGRRSGGARRGW